MLNVVYCRELAIFILRPTKIDFSPRASQPGIGHHHRPCSSAPAGAQHPQPYVVKATPGSCGKRYFYDEFSLVHSLRVDPFLFLFITAYSTQHTTTQHNRKMALPLMPFSQQPLI